MAFARACRAVEIQPVIGMTLAVREPDLPSPLPKKAGAGPGQLVLLATGPAGYRSLCRLSSLIQGHPEREALAARGLGWDELAAHREGLICLSGGRRGWIERYLRAGDYAAAQLYAGRLAGIFDENAVLALELHTPDDERIATEVVALGRRLGLPAVAVQPVYSLAPPTRRNCGCWRRSGRMRAWTTPSTSLWTSRSGRTRNRKKRAKNRMKRDEILR